MCVCVFLFSQFYCLPHSPKQLEPLDIRLHHLTLRSLPHPRFLHPETPISSRYILNSQARPRPGEQQRQCDARTATGWRHPCKSRITPTPPQARNAFQEAGGKAADEAHQTTTKSRRRQGWGFEHVLTEKGNNNNNNKKGRARKGRFGTFAGQVGTKCCQNCVFTLMNPKSLKPKFDIC